ncbi:uncharacterized protein NMK_0164 [Novimethylophilus kurashikiensis]|uniref:Uncharacterized protein n=1 Tax=Novimethylophilus kurashikiensis TaxID=1825523 RepID=A0A2R5F6T1_9PROT|nr:hypothetical protein [Novimethylophilus kurashikiensis]GBG12633.1 uncharacterized protein NMK_0164 [Novimethylophilus kurashikiensis]
MWNKAQHKILCLALVTSILGHTIVAGLINNTATALPGHTTKPMIITLLTTPPTSETIIDTKSTDQGKDTVLSNNQPASLSAVSKHESSDHYIPASMLDFPLLPKSAPDLESLDGLQLSGSPIRLRLFIDRNGLVVRIETLQAHEEDQLAIDQIKEVFSNTSFIPGKLQGVVVAAYQDIEFGEASIPMATRPLSIAANSMVHPQEPPQLASK